MLQTEYVNGLKGRYTFDIFLYRIVKDTEGNEEQELYDHFSMNGGTIYNNFVKEFTVTRLTDIGMYARFVVFDNTAYLPGMKPLGLLAWSNSSSTPILLRFKRNISDNMLMRRMQFDVSNFKSCVFEYDTNFMKGRLLV